MLVMYISISLKKNYLRVTNKHLLYNTKRGGGKLKNGNGKSRTKTT